MYLFFSILTLKKIESECKQLERVKLTFLFIRLYNVFYYTLFFLFKLKKKIKNKNNKNILIYIYIVQKVVFIFAIFISIKNFLNRKIKNFKLCKNSL